MSIPLEAVVGELHIIGGARQGVTRPTAALVAPRHAARGRASDTLFVLVDLRGPEPLPYEAVIERIEATYWRTPGSVTSALRAALTVTNDWLMDRNVQVEVNDRIRAGISCAVLRESEVFIAQAGPAAVYITHHGQVERFPAREVAPQALGAARAVEIRFSHAVLSPGDVVCLCDSATAERLTDDQVASATVYTGIEAALQNLEKLAGTNDLIALAFEAAPEAQAKAAIQAAIEKVAPQGEPAPPAQPARPLSALEVRPIKRPTTEEQVEADKTRWAQRMAERAASLPWLRRGEQRPRPQAQPPPDLTAQTETSAQPSTPVEPAGSIPWTRRIGALAGQINVRQHARTIVGSMAMGLAAVLRGLATVLQRTLPEDVAIGPRSRAANTALATLAALIPFVVAVLVGTSYMQYSTLEEYQARLNAARQEASQAAASRDPAERRKFWVSAMNQAEGALALFPDSAEARRAREEAQRAIDQIDNVVRISPSLLWDFRSPGPHRLAAQTMNLFVLDRASHQVFQLTLNEAGDGLTSEGKPQVRAYKSQNVSDRQVGDLVDLAWMPLGGTRTRASLVILDRGGLLDYDLAWNLKSIPLGQGPAPLGASAIAGFGGNLYLLDTIEGQVWRHKPQGEGYGSTRENYFDKPLDLSKAIDMAIDGNVYLLQSDGNIRKFFGGQEIKFVITGLNEPLKRPVALTVDAEARKGAVYIADAGAARIVQLSPDAVFIRQFSATGDTLNALEDLLVDERGGRLFVISGGRLYTARIPASP